MGTVRYTVVDGEVIAEKRGGVRRCYVPDPLGSTVALLDNTQAQTDTFAYWPYGENRPGTGTTPTPFQYVGTLGYHRDSASRDYVRRRVLRKDQARWLTEDPAGLNGGDLNLFRYGVDMPASESDPSGTSLSGDKIDGLRPASLAIFAKGCWQFKLKNCDADAQQYCDTVCTSIGCGKSKAYGGGCCMLMDKPKKGSKAKHYKTIRCVCADGSVYTATDVTIIDVPRRH